jgi:hypothetical protein
VIRGISQCSGAGRHIARDDAAGAEQAVVADCHARQDDRAAADPAVAADAVKRRPDGRAVSHFSQAFAQQREAVGFEFGVAGDVELSRQHASRYSVRSCDGLHRLCGRLDDADGVFVPVPPSSLRGDDDGDKWE